MKKNLLKNSAVQTLVASLICIVLGLFLGYLVLLLINPDGAGDAILTVIKNFWTYNRPASQMKYLGNTLVKTAPLLMCALSILFSYKVGLFNIGAAGQYCIGAALSLYAALGLGWSWLPCMLAAILGGALFLFGKEFLSLFTNEEAVVEAGLLRMRIMCFSYAISAFMDCTIAACRGLGRSLIPTIIVVLGSCVFRVIWVYTIFAHFHTIPSLYLLYPFSWILTAAAEIGYFIHCFRRLRPMQPQAAK